MTLRKLAFVGPICLAVGFVACISGQVFDDDGGVDPTGAGGSTVAGTGGAPGTGGTVVAGTGGKSGTGGAAVAGTGGRAIGLGTGGATTVDGGTTGPATFVQVAQILGTSCGTGTCHQGAMHVDLRNNAGLHARLVSAMPAGTQVMAQCRTRTLVVPSNPAMSVISQVIKAAVTGCTTTRMPQMCSTTSATPRRCLTAAQIATIDGWIMAGAPM
jgi:hypothetical protein